MNAQLLILEAGVIGLALLLLLLDLWAPADMKPKLGYVAALGVAIIFGLSFFDWIGDEGQVAFDGMFVRDGLTVFFDRFFLAAAFFVLLIAVEFADRLAVGITEFYALVLFALAGMMIAAGANDFILVFVALELITVTFYVLVSFQRSRLGSLEAGVKYLILGALSSAFLVFGIALIFGSANTTRFDLLGLSAAELVSDKIFWLGLIFVLVGLAFKIAAFPLQFWAPDVYQGAPAPTTAFLAIGSKAAGIVLLLRILFTAVPAVAMHWGDLLMFAAGVTILYGNLCAIPQRNLKRLLGYSSISNAGYLLLGFAALNRSGSAAVLYYLLGYLFALAAAFAVVALVSRDSDDITSLAGLGQRSPMLAAALTMAMVSLAGIPPLAGFFGKFLLLRSIIEAAADKPSYYCLTFVALAGVVMSLYYYFGVIRAIYWSKDPVDLTPIRVSLPMGVSLLVCMGGMLYLGCYPAPALAVIEQAVKVLKF